MTRLATAFTTALFAANVSATPINYYELPDTDYDNAVSGLTHTMLDIEGTALGPVASIGLTDGSGREVSVSDNSYYGTAGIYDGSAIGWWPDDRKFIGTHSNQIVLDFTSGDFLVQALSFDLVASFGNPRIWIETIVDGVVQRSDYYRPYAPAGTVLSYGLAMSAGAAGACHAISRVIIDPEPSWGITDVKIGENTGCVQVPEPGSLSLLGAGLLGLGLLQRARRRSTREPDALA